VKLRGKCGGCDGQCADSYPQGTRHDVDPPMNLFPAVLRLGRVRNLKIRLAGA
jgi:hypothetical protein